MENTYNQLLELVKLGIWPDYAVRPEIFVDVDWLMLYEQAKVQTVRGVAFEGVQRLTKDSSVRCSDRKIFLQWLAQVSKIQNVYLKHVAVLGRVQRVLSNANIKHVFMKGLVCGSRYPIPGMRTCGDIDFVVAPHDFSKTLDVLSTVSMVDRTLVHEHHGMARMHDVTLEPHYKVHNYQNHKTDSVMTDLFLQVLDGGINFITLHLDACSETGNREITFQVPTFPIEFEGMFLVSHMVNHVYEEGLGLRQVVDFALWAKKCATDSKFDMRLHGYYLQRMRLTRAHRIFVRICEKYLALPQDIFGYEYSKREMAFADKLTLDIMRVGNFGRGEYVFKRGSMRGDLQNYWWVTRRSLRLWYLCPSEALMWPISKFSRYFSKLCNPQKYRM